MKLQKCSDQNKIYHIKNSKKRKLKNRIRLSSVFTGLTGVFKNADNQQKRAGRNLFLFLLLMLVMTIIARGFSGAALAVVTTEMTFAGEVTEAVKGTAAITASEKQDIIVPVGFTVEEIFVNEGDKVQEGDLILKLSTEELNVQLNKEKLEIENLELKLGQLQQSIVYDDSALTSAKKVLERAREDYNTTKTNGEQSISNAQNQYNTVKAEYEAAQKSLENLQAAASKNSGNVSDNDEYIDYTEQIISAKELASTKMGEMKEAEEALQEARQQSEENLKAANRTIEDAELSVSDEEKNAANTLQENSLLEKQNGIDAKVTSLEIEETKKTVSALETLILADGAIKSDTNGNVLSIIQPGEKTTEAAVSSISNDNGMLVAEMTMSKDVVKNISVGDAAKLEKSEGGTQLDTAYSATVISISDASGDNDNESVTIKLQLSEDGSFIPGENLTAGIITKSGQYQNCVPLPALHSSGSGYYILVVEDKQTVLGTEKAVYAVPVTVTSMGDSVAAIDGDFSSTAQIVISSSKEVSDGDRVRLNS